MITKNKFRIGDAVLVKGEVLIEKGPSGTGFRCYTKRVITRHELPRESWYLAVVTGAGVRLDGETHHNGEDGSDFRLEKTHHVWLVRKATLGAEVPVFEQDLELIERVLYEHPDYRLPKGPLFTPSGAECMPFLRRARKPKLPWRPNVSVSTKAVRDELRDAMRDWPRGVGGRWKKPPVKVFHVWLGEQEERDDPVGDLAALLKQRNLLNWNLEAGPTSLLELLGQQKLVVVSQWETAVQKAWKEWWETA